MLNYFVESFSFAKDIILHPSEATKEEATTRELLIYLSVLSIIPAVIIGLVFAYVISSGISGVGLGLLIIGPIFAIVMIPVFIILMIISTVIGAGIIHFFGMFLGFKKDYSHTLAAVVYAYTPSLLFSWILTIFSFSSLASPAFTTNQEVSPASNILFLLVGIVMGFLLSLWSFVLQIIALSNQQQISKARAFGIILIPIMIALVIIIVIIGLAYFFISSILTQYTSEQVNRVGELSTSEIMCSYGMIAFRNLKYANEKLNGDIQNTGYIPLGDLKIQILSSKANAYMTPLCFDGSKAVDCPASKLELVPRASIKFEIKSQIGFSEITKIKIYTNCSSVYDEATVSEISTS